MKTYTVKAPDGKTITLQGPDNATQEEVIAQAQKLYQAQMPSVPKAGAPLPIPKELQPQSDDIPAELKALTIGVDPKAFADRTLGAIASVTNTLFPSGDTRKTSPQLPELTANQKIGEKAATIGAISEIVPAAGRAVKSLLPSTKRAGENFQKVMGAAEDVPLDLSHANKVAEEAEVLSSRGGPPLPKVIRDYIKAETERAADMAYREGRDWASNAGAQSVKEMRSMTPAMKAKVKEFARALGDANREAADKVGMGELYDQAMSEYRKAKNFGATVSVIRKYGAKAAIYAGLGGAGALGYEIYNR